ncbi:MAG: hypothetical protein IT442_17665 [Phycisphaeraceae bacterium]|nr:hypothetical protein [Phycisphaeraceae bacterium]
MLRNHRRTSMLAAAMLAGVMTGGAAGYVTVYTAPGTGWGGEPGYNFFSQGYVYAGGSTAAANAGKTDGAGVYVGWRGVRWDSSGEVVELGSLGSATGGYTEVWAHGLNGSGTAAGVCQTWGPMDVPLGDRAVRWDAAGVPTELGNLGLSATGYTNASALGISGSGIVAGYATKYDAATHANLGPRAVRWAAGGVTAEELGTLSAGGTGGSGWAYAVNDLGVAVGESGKTDEKGTSYGVRAARWAAGSTAATELDSLGESVDGINYSSARDVNAAGTAAGFSSKYNRSHVYVGSRAVRWSAGSHAATELGNLGERSDGYTHTSAEDINNGGTVVGSAAVFGSGDQDLGLRAVRWEAGGTAATALWSLRLRSDGWGASWARAINDTGVAVGYSSDFAPDDSQRFAAMMWGPEGYWLDLNTVIDPTGGWELTEAWDISETGWITGWGLYDPDGAGPAVARDQPWLLHVAFFGRGDFNLDGLVNVQDINPFVSALGGGLAYGWYVQDRLAELGLDVDLAGAVLAMVDPNGDGDFNVQDINPFVAKLAGGGVVVEAMVVPEPGMGWMIVVAAMAALSGGGRDRGWRR